MSPSIFPSLDLKKVMNDLALGQWSSRDVTYMFIYVMSGVVTLTAVLLGCVFTRSKLQVLRGPKKSKNLSDLGSSSNYNTDIISNADPSKWPVDDADNKRPHMAEGEKESIRDPVEFCSHIPGEVKRSTQRITREKVEQELSEDQKQHERDVQRDQLEAIFKLMQDQKDKFGVDTVTDVTEQMGLYGQ